MRLFFGLIGLILVCGNLSAKTPDPIIAVLYEDLGSRGKDDMLPKYEPCWDEKGKLISAYCQQEIKSCTKVDRYTARPEGELRIYFDETLHNLEKIHFAIPNRNRVASWQKKNQGNKRYNDFPWGSSLTVVAGDVVSIYSEDGIGSYKSLGIYTLDETLELRLNTRAYKKKLYKIELGKGWDINAKLIPYDLLNSHGLYEKKNKIEIELPSEFREIKLGAYHDDKYYLATVPLVKGGQTLSVDVDKFKIIPSPEPIYHYMDINKGFHVDEMVEILRSKGEENTSDSEEVFLSIDSIKIKDHELDIKKYFKLDRGIVLLEEKDKFHELVMNYPSFEIELVGSCGILYKRSLKNKIEIKDAPKGKVIGHLQVYFERGLRSEYLDVKNSKPLEFEVNLKTSLEALYHQVSEVVDGDANLGSGPWGVKGWATLRSDRLYKDRVYFFQDSKSDKTYEYYKTYSGRNYLREVPLGDPRRMSLSTGKKYEVIPQQHFDENGIFKNTIVDVFGKRSEAKPGMVDLTNGQIFLGGNEKEVETNVYLKPYPEAVVIGTLRFDRDGDILKGSYLAKNAMSAKPFIPNAYLGRCGHSVYFTAVHNTSNVYQDFSSLGKGPWGSEAWVRTKHFIPSEDIPRYDVEIEDNETLVLVSNRWTSVCGKRPGRDFKPDFEPMFVNLLPIDGDTTKTQDNRKKEDTRIVAVYQQPDSKSQKIGEIEINYYAKEGVFNFLNGKIDEFELDIYSGICHTINDGEKRVQLRSVVESKDGWSNLGAGVWGDMGWIEVRAELLLRSDFRFNISWMSSANVKRFDNGKVLFTPSADYYEESDTELPVRDLVDSEGRFRYKLECEGGC